MSIVKPSFLLVMNQATGAILTNYGTAGTGYAVQQGAETTDWVDHATGGPYGGLGYFESKTGFGSSMPYLSSAATAPDGAMDTINFAVGFRVTSLNDSDYCELVHSQGGDGDVDVVVNGLSGGTYELNARFTNTGSGQTDWQTWTGLTVGTDYLFSCSLDVTDPSNAIPRHKLDSATVVTGPTANFGSGFELQPNWPWVLTRGDSFTTFGFVGRINLWVYQRGGTAWSSGDLDTINANPASAFAGANGWPSAGVAGTAFQTNAFQSNAFSVGASTAASNALASSGAVTISDTVTPTAVGTLAATGAVVVSATTAFNSPGTLAATGAVTISDAVTPTAKGTLAATGAVTISDAVTLTAVGTLAATGAVAVSATTAFNSPGTLAATGAVTISDAVTPTAVGTLAATGAVTISDAITPTAIGTLAATGAVTISDAVTPTAVGTLAATGAVAVSATTAFNSPGALAATGAVTISDAVTPTAVGTLAATGAVVISEASDLSAASSDALVSVGAVTISDAVTLTAVGTLAATGAVAVSATTAFNSPGTLAAMGTVAIDATVVLTAAGALASVGATTIGDAAALRATGALASVGAVSLGNAIAATAIGTLAAVGAVVISASVVPTDGGHDNGTLVALEAPDNADFDGHAIASGALTVSEAPDYTMMSGNAVGALEPPLQIANGPPAHYVPTPKVTGALRVSESRDVAIFIGRTDWSNDDEDILLMMEAA